MPAQIHILWTDSFPAPVVSKVQFNQRLQFHQLFREAFQVIFLTQSVHSSEGGCWPRGIRRRKPITCWTKGWLRELLQCAESSTVQSGITATKNQEYHKNMIRGSSRSKNRQDYVIWYMYMHVHVCIHILAWYRKNITLYLSTLFGQPCYQPRRWKIQSLELLEVSSVAFQNISKICSKVARPPCFSGIQLGSRCQECCQETQGGWKLLQFATLYCEMAEMREFLQAERSRNLHILKPWERQEWNAIFKMEIYFWTNSDNLGGILLCLATDFAMRWYLTRKPVNHEATVPNRLTSHCPFHVGWYLYMPLYQVIEFQCRRSFEQIKSTRPYKSRLVSRIFWTNPPWPSSHASISLDWRSSSLWGLVQHLFSTLDELFGLEMKMLLEMMTESPLVATQGAHYFCNVLH